MKTLTIALLATISSLATIATVQIANANAIDISDEAKREAAVVAQQEALKIANPEVATIEQRISALEQRVAELERKMQPLHERETKRQEIINRRITKTGVQKVEENIKRREQKARNQK